jgi:hypothetical protein
MAPAPASRSTTQQRTKRVSVQHTQERVRNNQRRHRARQKDHIASLERKLGEAELTISTLGNQVGALQAALKRLYRKTNPPDKEECRVQSLDGASPPPLHGIVLQTNDLAPWSRAVLASGEPFAPDNQSRFKIDMLSSPGDETCHALAATDAQVASTSPGAIAQSHTAPTPCCYRDSSTDSEPTAHAAGRETLFLRQETPPLIPASVLQPAWPCAESTIACSEAYLLIAQQNFKGMNQGDVTAWLCSGFRMSVQRGEGCRVQTDILFSLLAYISDTSSELLADVTT